MILKAEREALRIRQDAEAYAEQLMTSAQEKAEASMEAVERSVLDLALIENRRVEVAKEIAALEKKRKHVTKRRR